MPVELKFTPTKRHLNALQPPTLEINVWPKSQVIPDGQVEVITPRGRSVAFSHDEWLLMTDQVRGTI